MACYNLWKACRLKRTASDRDIIDPTNVGQDLAGYFTPEEWAETVHDDISLD